MIQCGSSRLARGNVNCPLHHTKAQYRQNIFYFHTAGGGGSGGSSSHAAPAAEGAAAEPERVACIQQRFPLAQLPSMPAETWYAWHAFSGTGLLQLRVKKLV